MTALLSTRDVARLLGCSIRTAQRHARPHARRVGHTLVVSESDLPAIRASIAEAAENTRRNIVAYNELRQSEKIQKKDSHTC